MGLIPFLTVCLQVWGQVLICLSLFLPSLASSLSFTPVSLPPCSHTDGSSHSLFFPFHSPTSLSLSTSHFLSFFLNPCITLSLCLFVSSLCYLMFSSTTPLQPFDSPLLLLLFLSFSLPPPHCFACSISPSSSLDSFCLSSYTFLAHNTFIQYVSVCSCVSLCEEAVVPKQDQMKTCGWFEVGENRADENRGAKQKHMIGRSST